MSIIDGRALIGQERASTKITDEEYIELIEAYVRGDIACKGLKAAFRSRGIANGNEQSKLGRALMRLIRFGKLKLSRV